MKKAVIFDFDGTIADTMKVAFEIMNEYSERYGFEKLSKKEIEKIRTMSAREILKKYQIPIRKTPFILKMIRTEMFAKSDKIKAYKGINNVIKELKSNGFQIGIMTLNSKELVKKVLGSASDLVDFIDTQLDIFGRHMKILRTLEAYNLKKEDVIVIGDEIRDIEAAKKAEVPIIAVSWGYNTKKALKEHKPDYLITKPQEILNILKV